MTQKSLVGTWRLISCELRREDGKVNYPFGKDASGNITYTEDGHMFVAVMSSNRTKFASGDFRGGTTEETLAAASTYLSYCGKYDIHGNEVIHRIEVSSYPNWIGVDQGRIFEFDGDRLILSSQPLLVDGVQQTFFVVWERV
ncbi:MAG: lipocalin-like domain-containing protein [Promethearchaeota archaeon]